MDDEPQPRRPGRSVMRPTATINGASLVSGFIPGLLELILTMQRCMTGDVDGVKMNLAKSTSRGQTYHHGDLRAALLAAAEAELAERGIGG
jgi:hypothetical protein